MIVCDWHSLVTMKYTDTILGYWLTGTSQTDYVMGIGQLHSWASSVNRDVTWV